MLVIEENVDPKWLLAIEKLATKNMAIENYGNQKLWWLKHVGTRIYDDQILVVIEIYGN